MDGCLGAGPVDAGLDDGPEAGLNRRKARPRWDTRASLFATAPTAMDQITVAHPPVTRPLTADDIQWEPAPVAITTDDLLVEALLDAESYRAIAQEALHALARLTTRHRRLIEVHRHLRERLRESR